MKETKDEKVKEIEMESTPKYGHIEEVMRSNRLLSFNEWISLKGELQKLLSHISTIESQLEEKDKRIGELEEGIEKWWGNKEKVRIACDLKRSPIDEELYKKLGRKNNG